MTDDDDRKRRAQEVRERARKVLARVERSKAPVVLNGASTHHLRAQRDQIELENRLTDYVNGDLRALDGYDEAPPEVFVLPEKRKRPTKMDTTSEQRMNAWFVASFNACLAPVIEEFNKSNANIKAIFDDLESILETIDRDLQAVAVDVENRIAKSRVVLRAQVGDDLQTDVNKFFRDVESILNKKMDSRFKAIRAVIKQARAKHGDNVTNLHQRKS